LKPQLFACAALFAAMSAVPVAEANSVLGDAFTLQVVDLDGGGPGDLAIADAGAGSDVRSDPDVVVTYFGTIVAHVRWVDADSFDLAFLADPAAGFAQDLGSVTVTLGSLDFVGPGGGAIDILGATFNVGASDYLGYLASEDNPTGAPAVGGPTVTTTARSVTVNMTGFSGQLLGDQPIFRFDVTAVPEPGTVVATLVGLGLLGAGVRRRSRSRTVAG
jgi:hypothetical protein